MVSSAAIECSGGVVSRWVLGCHVFNMVVRREAERKQNSGVIQFRGSAGTALGTLGIVWVFEMLLKDGRSWFMGRLDGMRWILGLMREIRGIGGVSFGPRGRFSLRNLLVGQISASRIRKSV